MVELNILTIKVQVQAVILYMNKVLLQMHANTKDGGWFSMGNFMNSGRLDVDGELTKILNAR